KDHSRENVRGCNLAFWKADFIAVNGYNNSLKGWGHEDEELAARMVNSGVLKKSVKWRCIQFHIYHQLSSRESEQKHHNILENVRAQHITRAVHGYDESGQ